MDKLKASALGTALTLYLASPVYALGPFPNEPLSISGSVPPNVMLLVDNSGSMYDAIPLRPTIFTKVAVVITGEAEQRMEIFRCPL